MIERGKEGAQTAERWAGTLSLHTDADPIHRTSTYVHTVELPLVDSSIIRNNTKNLHIKDTFQGTK